MPDLLVLLFLVGDIVLHHNHLVLAGNISFRDSSIVNVNLTIHFHVLVLETHQILVIFVSLDWDRAVVVKEKVEERNVLSISVVFETERLFSDIEHEVSEESEENFRRSVFASLLNFIGNILDLDINVLEASFGLKTHTDGAVDFDSGKWERIVIRTELFLQLIDRLYLFEFIEVFFFAQQV